MHNLLYCSVSNKSPKCIRVTFACVVTSSGNKKGHHRFVSTIPFHAADLEPQPHWGLNCCLCLSFGPPVPTSLRCYYASPLAWPFLRLPKQASVIPAEISLPQVLENTPLHPLIIRYSHSWTHSGLGGKERLAFDTYGTASASASIPSPVSKLSKPWEFCLALQSVGDRIVLA